MTIQLQKRNNCQQAPTTSPGLGMGACHHGGSRFIALDTPLCPRFMPRPRAFFRNTYLLHDIGAVSPVAPDFSNAGGSPVCCLGRVRPLGPECLTGRNGEKPARTLTDRRGCHAHGCRQDGTGQPEGRSQKGVGVRQEAGRHSGPFFDQTARGGEVMG